LVVCLNTIAQGGGSNLFPPEEFDTFTQEEIDERIYGSKIVVISEQAMLNVIYCIKVCMLIMYTRLTLGLQQQKTVRYLAVYVGCGWLASEIAFFTACRPFEGYWGMPPPDSQCTTLQYYAIVQGCFNITSDLLMLCVPIPLVLNLKVALQQKIVLLLIFSLGLFVVVAALLTKIFNLSDIWDPSYMLWYVREASVAVYVANLPMIWPLLREWIPFLGTISSTSYHRSTKNNQNNPTRRQHRKGSLTLDWAAQKSQRAMASITGNPSRSPSSRSAESAYDLEMGVKPTEFLSEERRVKVNITGMHGSDSESQEHIIGAARRPSVIDQKHGGIQVERTIVVREEKVEHSNGKEGYDWETQGVSRSN
jgi:hypothetical protein